MDQRRGAERSLKLLIPSRWRRARVADSSPHIKWRVGGSAGEAEGRERTEDQAARGRGWGSGWGRWALREDRRAALLGQAVAPPRPALRSPTVASSPPPWAVGGRPPPKCGGLARQAPQTSQPTRIQAGPPRLGSRAPVLQRAQILNPSPMRGSQVHPWAKASGGEDGGGPIDVGSFWGGAYVNGEVESPST